MALSQRAIGLYTLRVNPSTVQLNAFARHALSQLTSNFDLQLYEDFLDAWGTHIITKTLIGGMIEEQAEVKRCLFPMGNAAISRCIPFSDRNPSDAQCKSVASQSKVTSKRWLGGNIVRRDENSWKRTLASDPALLQILEIVPWYHFVSDEKVKANLRTAIDYRQKASNDSRAATIQSINKRQSPWYWCGINIIVL